MTANELLHYDPDAHQLSCSGDWDLANLPKIKAFLDKITRIEKSEVTVDGSAITKMDSAGAWLINSWKNKLGKKGITANFEGFPSRCAQLIALIDGYLQGDLEPQKVTMLGYLGNLGKSVITMSKGFTEYLSFIGLLTYEFLRISLDPRHLRVNYVAKVIYHAGYAALPIIALLSLMIGVVITYQMGLQLKNYGANIFIVDLLGVAILREFGPLLTAIMVAGRSGSAFTAQLGMMKINQEVDALNTLGVTPSEMLFLPRIIGLLIALPLLVMWADIIGVIGGMIMSNNMLGISWYDFLRRFPEVIPLKDLLVGLGKTPVYALIIATVGCFQAAQVTTSADSVGTRTTRSVVMAIFFIIVADALFSILFSELKI